MCLTRTTTYLTCAHRRTTRERCQNYHSEPRQKCKKLLYNDTVLGLCSKCSRMPSQVSIPPAYNQNLGTGSVQCGGGGGGGSSIVDSKSTKSGLGIRRKFSSMLKRIFGSAWRDGGGGNERSFRDIESSQSKERPSKETESSVRSSEKIAEEYVGIIGNYPRSAYEHVHVTAIPKYEDIETCTTWSRFLPRRDALAPREAEGSSNPVNRGYQTRSTFSDEISRKHEVA